MHTTNSCCDATANEDHAALAVLIIVCCAVRTQSHVCRPFTGMCCTDTAGGCTDDALINRYSTLPVPRVTGTHKFGILAFHPA